MGCDLQGRVIAAACAFGSLGLALAEVARVGAAGGLMGAALLGARRGDAAGTGRLVAGGKPGAAGHRQGHFVRCGGTAGGGHAADGSACSVWISSTWDWRWPSDAEVEPS